MIFNHGETGMQWSRTKEFTNAKTWNNNSIEGYIGSKTFNIPAILGMNGLFVLFDVRFVLIHVAVFIVSFLAFYACCLAFLKAETDPKDKKTIIVNRQRFKYLLYISYVFVDTCYMLIEFVTMLNINVPSKLEEALDKYKIDKVIDGFKSLNSSITFTSSNNEVGYYALKTCIRSQPNIKAGDKAKLIKMVQSLPNRDTVCNCILSQKSVKCNEANPSA